MSLLQKTSFNHHHPALSPLLSNITTTQQCYHPSLSLAMPHRKGETFITYQPLPDSGHVFPASQRPQNSSHPASNIALAWCNRTQPVGALLIVKCMFNAGLGGFPLAVCPFFAGT